DDTPSPWCRNAARPALHADGKQRELRDGGALLHPDWSDPDERPGSGRRAGGRAPAIHMALIELQDVEFAYGAIPVLRRFSLVVNAGEITVLVGPSGSGKSTVLRLIAGFEAPQRGRLAMNGDVMAEDGRILRPPETRGVSMVFQDLALWPNMTVADTLAFVLGTGLDREERRRRIAETLTAVALDRHANARPAQLSGGERQRLAIA